MTFLHQYLLQASICLTLLYGVYALLLRQDTFHQLNRFFLLLVLAGTVILPIFDLSFFLKNHQGITQNQVVQLMPDLSFRQTQNVIQISVFQLFTTLYWAGVIVFAIRFLVQIFSVLSLFFESKSLKIHGIKVRILERKLNPFSFFKLIFINPTLHSEEDLAEILAHEYTHARQFHSLDVMLVEVFLVVFWFHPLAWFQRKSLKQNLEFLTDQSVLQSGFDAQRYQYSLLKVNGLKPISELANSFNFSDLKLRINMMNRERSARWKVSKYVIAVPILAFLMLAFNITKGKNLDKKNVFKELVKMVKSVEIVAEKRQENIENPIEKKEEKIITETEFILDSVQKAKPAKTTMPQRNAWINMVTIEVLDAQTKKPMEGVEITSVEKNQVQKTNLQGVCVLELAEQHYEKIVGNEYKNLTKIAETHVKIKYKDLSPQTFSFIYFGRIKTFLFENNTFTPAPEKQSTVNLSQEYYRKSPTEKWFYCKEDIIKELKQTQELPTQQRPAYLINNRNVSENYNWDLVSINSILYLNYLKPEDGINWTKKYGENAANGVYDLVVLKKVEVPKDYKFTTEYIPVSKPMKPAKICTPTTNFQEDVLWVVDGNVQESDSLLRNLNPNEICKMEVMEKKKANKTYGLKAKNGVVEIWTCKDKSKN
jgi:hypothetical protein